jgi:predicted pyridoxine 5'-phosphate oxidase superfamily flavin-nucleotide-binding protein
MDRYDQLMFTPKIKALQDLDGVADTYAAQYARKDRTSLGEDEVSFLESRTSIYMASVSETGWPYIQHRGGPRGFLKVLDAQTIGFADYRGNRQHISEGNIQHDARVSLFAMDYPRKARMKLQGHAQFQNAAEDPELAQRLAVQDQGRVERLVTITIAAFDWNCPQFITPRFDTEEISALVGPEMDRLTTRITELEAALAKATPQQED